MSYVRISPDNKYVFFEDLSGGIDSMYRVYSVDKDFTATLTINGTSSIFDLEFTQDNFLGILYGFKDSYAEQSVAFYNLNALFASYPTNVNEYSQFTDISKHSKIIPLPNYSQNYVSIKFADSLMTLTGSASGKIIYAMTIEDVKSGILEECTPCTANVSTDSNYVDILDFSLVSSCIGKKSTEVNSSGLSCKNTDINQDGSINGSDVSCIQNMYSKLCVK